MRSTIFTALFVIFVLPCVVEAQVRIVFESSRGDGNREIYVMDADGGNPRNLTNNPGAQTFILHGLILLLQLLSPVKNSRYGE